MNNKFPSFFIVLLLFLAVFAPTTLAQPSQGFKVDDYAEYTIAAAQLGFANGTFISADNSKESTLTWTIVNIASSNITLNLDLKIPVMTGEPLEYSATLFVVDRKAYFTNYTEWGYLPFWINSDTKLNDVANVSGKDTLLVKGHVDSDTNLKETPSNGWQECYIVECDSILKIFNFTLPSSSYNYDKDSGILLGMASVNDPISSLFGDFIISGGLSLSSTNIDLGPQSYRFILIYLVEIWPILLMVFVFVAGFLVHRVVTKRSKARRKD